MNALIIGLYGIYLLLVGMNGKSSDLLTASKADMPGFLPWAVSLGVLAVLNDIPQTKKVVAPFLMLLILNFILRNFDTLKAQFQQLSQMAANATASNTSTAAPATNSSTTISA